jgi:actin-related protein
LKKTEVDEIVLVGGSTRIPKVQQLLKEFFLTEKSPTEESTPMKPSPMVPLFREEFSQEKRTPITLFC